MIRGKLSNSTLPPHHFFLLPNMYKCVASSRILSTSTVICFCVPFSAELAHLRRLVKLLRSRSGPPLLANARKGKLGQAGPREGRVRRGRRRPSVRRPQPTVAARCAVGRSLGGMADDSSTSRTLKPPRGSCRQARPSPCRSFLTSKSIARSIRS